MLTCRLRRRPNISPTPAQCLMFALCYKARGVQTDLCPVRSGGQQCRAGGDTCDHARDGAGGTEDDRHYTELRPGRQRANQGAQEGEEKIRRSSLSGLVFFVIHMCRCYHCRRSRRCARCRPRSGIQKLLIDVMLYHQHVLKLLIQIIKQHIIGTSC